MTKDIEDLQMRVVKFRDDRDWKQFHNPKDLSMSLILEAAELLEHFQWKNDIEMAKHVADNKISIAEEMADVFYWLLLMSNDMGIDLTEAVKDKLDKNALKYPIEKSKGRHTKYNQL